MRIKSQRDFLAGLLFVALGIALDWGATTLRFGSAHRMGTGWMPIVFGALIAGVGAFIVFGSLVVETEDGAPLAPWGLRPAVAVLGSVLVFGAMVGGVPAAGLPRLGLIAACFVLPLICSWADASGWSMREAVVLSAVLGALAMACVSLLG